MTIKVSLDTTAKPPVSVNPTKENVNQGNQTITWVPDSKQPPFQFANVKFWTTPNPFSPPTVTTNPVQMQVTENNTASGDFPYTLYVTLNGKTYDSGIPPKPTAGGGTPVIHNN